MAHDADILIVGGGLNGPCLAIALAKSGPVSSIVIDALPEDTRMAAEFDGRSYALALASVRMLGALGLWGTLEDNAQPILEIKASDGRAGEGAAPQFLHFDHAEIEEGPMGHMLEDRHLRRALLDAMDQSAADHPHAGRKGCGAGHRNARRRSRSTMAAP
jgi:2-octaprenyl-6-methoxyphenol hydroxylase